MEILKALEAFDTCKPGIRLKAGKNIHGELYDDCYCTGCKRTYVSWTVVTNRCKKKIFPKNPLWGWFACDGSPAAKYYCGLEGCKVALARHKASCEHIHT